MKSVRTLLIHLGVGRKLGKEGKSWSLISPMREWAVCLLATFAVGLGLFGYAALDFYDQLNDTQTLVAAEGNIPKYRSADAELIINYYEGKERAFTALRGYKPVSTTPLEQVADEGAGG